jgi:peptidoglycan/xylan/chitin deacetylase (PgdA/CDA1 family)
VSLDQFKEHLRFAQANTLEVTLDDGEITQYMHAFPALQEQGVLSTVFVLPGLVDREKKYMTWAQIKEMAQCGHEIQSHGWGHRFLTECNPNDLREELSGARLEIESRLGKPVTAMSIPYGRYNRRVLNECARAGYSTVYTSDPWDATHPSGVRICGRTMVTRSMNTQYLESILHASHTRRAANVLRHTLKRCVRGAIGDSLYHRLWCHLSGYDEQEAGRANQSQHLAPTSHDGDGS